MNLRTYSLLQIPGWVLAALILTALWQWFGLSLWLSVLIFVLWVVKDLALFPAFRNTFRAEIKSGTPLLIGSRGVVREAIDPKGYVQVKGELWRAEASRQDQSIPPGRPIRVREARGLTLVVEESDE